MQGLKVRNDPSGGLCGKERDIWVQRRHGTMGASNEAGHGSGHRGVSVDTGAHGFGTAFQFLFKVGIMLSLTAKLAFPFITCQAFTSRASGRPLI
ncbi:hypothetical protein FH972_015934 [Carpinus fangiana]|uniref:Uncharacterized protein n=1 Tax=Carpinus fangiana TaxID=176857 RepID=A0A5N6REB7_9ROSI|nr:hypothetical protein FH972_015934 [Carpinus fangiana]